MLMIDNEILFVRNGIFAVFKVQNPHIHEEKQLNLNHETIN